MNGAVRKGLLVGAALAGVIAVAPGARAGKPTPPQPTTPEYHAVEAVPASGWSWDALGEAAPSSMSGVGIWVETLTSASDACSSRVGAWSWNGLNGGTTTVLEADESPWAEHSHRARAISTDGEYIVGVATEGCFVTSVGALAWRWSGVRWEYEPMLPCSDTVGAHPDVAGVSNDGLAVGWCSEPLNPPTGPYRAVPGAWRRGADTWVWEPFFSAPPSLSYRPRAVNDDGLVAGTVTLATNTWGAVAWRRVGSVWVMTTLSVPDGYSSARVTDIAQDGTILGGLWPTAATACSGTTDSDGWVKVTWSYDAATGTWPDQDPKLIDCVDRYSIEATASDGLVAAGTRVEVSGRSSTSYGVRTRWSLASSAWVTERLENLDDSDVRLGLGLSVGLDGSIVATGAPACRNCTWRRMVLFPIP